MNCQYTEFQKEYVEKLKKNPEVKHLIEAEGSGWEAFENNIMEPFYRGPKRFLFHGVDGEIHMHKVGVKKLLRRIKTTFNGNSIDY